MMTLRIEEVDSTNSWVKEHEVGCSSPSWSLPTDRQQEEVSVGKLMGVGPYMNLTASICLRPEGILPSGSS